jgi:hypothetical protein
MTIPQTKARTGPLEVVLSSDLLAHLSDREQAMLPPLLDACAEMDRIFWAEAYGDGDALLGSIDDPHLRRLVEFNHGPWDRMSGDSPFVADADPKSPGARFYPTDMTTAEFETACAESPGRALELRSEYTLVRRDAKGRLVAIPYHEAFAGSVRRASADLREAARLADDPGLRRYLELRADALLTDDYRESDLAWLDMKSNSIDVIIGPIENYEDALLGRKAAHQGILLIKDRDRTAALERVSALLPDLQRGLPVPPEYKSEMPGVDGDLGVYDVLAYTGFATPLAPSAVNLPNDEELQLEKGARRLQLRNAMRPVFEAKARIIAELMLTSGQRDHLAFEAYFDFVLCHEIGHGLGVKHTRAGGSTVRDALRDQHSAVEEGKADMLGLHLLARLIDGGELPDVTLLGAYVAYTVDTFGIIRRGASSDHARNNLANLRALMEAGAIRRDPRTERYEVDVPTMRQAVDSLVATYLRFQGDGDYEGSLAFIPKEMDLEPALKADLDRLAAANIPKGNWFHPAVTRRQRETQLPAQPVPG